MKQRIKWWAGQLGLKLIRWSSRESNLLRHAKREWEIAFPDQDEMQSDIGQDILDMVSLFSIQGHSGFSANYARQYVDKALQYAPFTPLTGNESEWAEPFCNEGTQQNKRCSHVFRNPDGTCYDIQGKVFRDPDGCTYTNRESRVPVTFPYIPKTEIVEVSA